MVVVVISDKCPVTGRSRQRIYVDRRDKYKKSSCEGEEFMIEFIPEIDDLNCKTDIRQY